MEKLTKEEEERSNYLLQLKTKHEQILEKIRKELLPLLYKLDRKI